MWHFTNEKVAEPVWSIHKNAIYDNMLSYASVHKFNIYLFIYLVGLTSTNNWLKLHPIFFLLREFTLHAPLNFISPKYNTYFLWEIYVSWALTKQVSSKYCLRAGLFIQLSTFMEQIKITMAPLWVCNNKDCKQYQISNMNFFRS